MVKFSLKKPLKLVVKGACQSVIPNPQGIPMVVNVSAKVLDLKAGIFETDDQEVIDRIRRDGNYNVIDGIMEISEEEQEVLHIRAKKDKEANEEIKEMKKRKNVK